MYSVENKSEESRTIQNNSEKHVPTAQFKDNRSQNETEKGMTAQLEKKENLTGMPDNLKEGIESLSGFSMDDVRVHYNSSKPATVQALAYTQGTDIHVAPGQEKCLPHEAWHVAQQMAGRVSPTTNINGMPVNDNVELEREADVMGEKAVVQRKMKKNLFVNENKKPNVIQMVRKDPLGFSTPYENRQDVFGKNMSFNRDHIIPHELLESFCKKLLNGVDSIWGEKAEEAYQTGKSKNEGRTKKDPFFNETVVDDVNKFCWMPGNIFLAPCPKSDDGGNEFDVTFASASGVDSYNVVRPYRNAYTNIKNALEETDETKKNQYTENTIKNLDQIAKDHTGIWSFDENNWLYDIQNDRSYAKKIVKDEQIVDNPRIAGTMLLSKKSEQKRDLYAMSTVKKENLLRDEKKCWNDAVKCKTNLKKKIREIAESINNAQDILNNNKSKEKLEEYINLQKSIGDHNEENDKLKTMREELIKKMINYRCDSSNDRIQSDLTKIETEIESELVKVKKLKIKMDICCGKLSSLQSEEHPESYEAKVSEEDDFEIDLFG